MRDLSPGSRAEDTTHVFPPQKRFQKCNLGGCGAHTHTHNTTAETPSAAHQPRLSTGSRGLEFRAAASSSSSAFKAKFSRRHLSNCTRRVFQAWASSVPRVPSIGIIQKAVRMCCEGELAASHRLVCLPQYHTQAGDLVEQNRMTSHHSVCFPCIIL